MKTNVVMETIDRELCGVIVRQRTKDSFMCLNDVMFVINEQRHKERKEFVRFEHFLQLENTKEFLNELEKEIGCSPYIKGAKNRVGWIHPFFAIKILTHYNPRFEVQVYKWLWDFLIQKRIDSSDSYNKMCGALFKYTSRKDKFTKDIQVVANMIKEKCKCENWNNATQEQLKDRDYLQNMIADLTQTCKNSRLGVKMALQVFSDRIV